MTATTRPPLTRHRIIEAAVTYADEHGVEDMSMRKLGGELGVEAMSLYNHLANKDAIYDGMIDRVFEEIALPDPTLDWQDQIREVGAAAMERFSAHHWVVTLLMQRGNFGPGALAFMERILALLGEAGFEDGDVHHAWQMLASHTMGYAFQQASNPSGKENEFLDVERRMAQLAPVFPHVARLAPLLAQCEWASEYLFGLEIIIDGLESRLTSDE